jgi:protein-S-isoprenylcysteine O-methyltransferase Ste14
MNLRVASILAFVMMAASVCWLLVRHQLLANTVPGQAVQIAAIGLLLWARATFGRRSFHAAASPTAGGLVTSGPYRFIRHPIYAAILYFLWAAALDHRTWVSIAAAAVVTIGAIVRMYAEERLLARHYPDYLDYARRTRRVVPFLV